MNENSPISIHSEIAPLKKVMLFRPGRELENLVPEYLERLLFDDIPYLKTAQQEHDAFAETLKSCGAEVIYLDDLLKESITDRTVREQFIRQFIFEAGIRGERRTEMIYEHFAAMTDSDMIAQMISGVRKSEIPDYARKNLTDYLSDEYPFLIDPMPNLYFTRDPFACAGNGVSIHRMSTVTRNRETLFAEYIFRYHPVYKNVPHWFERSDNDVPSGAADYAGCEAISGSCDSTIEGGDILILNSETIAIGISERTQPYAIEHYAKAILDPESGAGFKKVIAIDIPKIRSFMHLDTVFTMVDKNKFTVHSNLQEHMNFFVLRLDEDHKLIIEDEQDDLENMLRKHLCLDNVEIIKCGGGHPVDAAREQWNDGSNTLAVAPGEVIVYSRNNVTNRILQEHGIKTHVIPSSELSRGRGGPRCMSMPFVRG
ncbi:MAG: arginine deiminase [Anaerovoracaceae bacterium]